MSLFKYTKEIIVDESKAIWAQLMEIRVLVILFLISLFAVVVYLEVIPDRHIYIGSSYSGSDLYQFGEKASEYLNKKGVRSTVVITDGAVDNVNHLMNPKDPVNAALTYGIALNEDQRKQVVSLGSVDYAPIWIFYHADKVKNFKNLHDLLNYRVSLGPLQSGSYVIAKKLLGLYDIDVDKHHNFISESFEKSEDDFLSGATDVLIFVSGMNDPLLCKLIAAPGVSIYSFTYAPALEKRYNSFKAVELPAGAISSYPLIPTENLSLLATTASVAVNKNMNPDLQLALLMAMREMNRDSQNLMFAKRDEFPAYVDPIIPISPIAAKFYDYGPPQVMRYLPFWIAGFVDRAWVILLTLFAIFYPLSKLKFNFRNMRLMVHERNHYQELFEMDKLVTTKKLTVDQKNILLEQLSTISKCAVGHGLPIGSESNYFNLLNSIEILRKKIEIN